MCVCLFGWFCVSVCVHACIVCFNNNCAESNVVCLVQCDVLCDVLCVYICEYYGEMCLRGCCVSCVLDYLCM